MADTKITDFISKTPIVATDEFYINDVAGGNADKKTTGAGIKTFCSDSPTLVTPNLGTPSAGTLTNCTGLPASGVVGTAAVLGANTFTGNQDMGGNDVDNIQNLIHDISTSGTDIDFDEDEMQTISISTNTTFTTANRAAGKSKTLKITTDGTLRTLTFPAWDWVSSVPADQAASKNGYLTLTCYGSNEGDIVAAYQVGSL